MKFSGIKIRIFNRNVLILVEMRGLSITDDEAFAIYVILLLFGLFSLFFFAKMADF